MQWRWGAVLMAGVALGLVLGSAATTGAQTTAAGGGCRHYLVVTKTASGLGAVKGDAFARMTPEGWEPFSVGVNSNGGPLYALRKCVP